MKKHPALIVLKALLQGQVVTLRDFSYMMAEDVNGKQRVWLAKTNSPGWLAQITLDQFIQDCNEIPEPELFIIGANNALNDIARERPRREIA